MKQIFFCLTLLFAALCVQASKKSVNALLLHCKSGKVTIMLKEQPVVTFVANELVVRTHMDVIRYPAPDVVKFTYVNVNSTNIKTLEKENVLIALDDNIISVYNLSPHENVMIYSVDGKLLSSSVTDSFGKVCMKIPTKMSSVFLLKTLFLTFKISKP